ncbi:MAG: molybdopterin-dependent oxidoreductase [Burkholderiales bacterium]|nr:molybdopterin-dependent oxidoreductase [Burkholderiales bacterium]
MDKRQFLVAGALGATLPLQAPASPSTARTGPGLLTVAGSISRSNRGPLNPALDQLMVKHGIKFDKAWEFDFAMLARLPAVTIQPTLEYDAKPHRLSGPLLSAVVGAAGVAAGASVMLALRALDGYTVAVSLADAQRYRMIVATKLDGVPMSIGGLGPVWAVYDADRLADFKDKPLKDRFALCPWGMYFIDVTTV